MLEGNKFNMQCVIRMDAAGVVVAAAAAVATAVQCKRKSGKLTSLNLYIYDT